MATKTIAARQLDTHKIAYSLHDYEWSEEEGDAASVAFKVGLPASHLFKTLVLRGDKTGVIMACVPGDRELNLKALAALSGNKKVEMAAVKELQALTGYVRGGVSPLGAKKDFPLFIDESAAGLDPISISAGRRGTQIFLAGADLIRLRGATAGAITL